MKIYEEANEVLVRLIGEAIELIGNQIEGLENKINFIEETYENWNGENWGEAVKNELHIRRHKGVYNIKEREGGFQITKIAPYDEAKYYWARIQNNKVLYILDSKIKKEEEYINKDKVIRTLIELNKTIESKIAIY